MLVLGIALGLGVTWFTVVRGGLSSDISDGVWRTSLDIGSSSGNMATRARVAVHGLLALNRSETMYYSAATDSSGAALDGRCTYRLRGSDPKTRWWSITAYGADDYMIPNEAHRYAVSKNSITRDPDGTFNVMVSKENGGENWIYVKPGPFSLTLRLYNPDAGVVADPAHAALPTVVREAC